MTDHVDVVAVADFRGENAAIYEGQTLLFLASWLQNAGRCRDMPLHIACIGDAPQSVAALAEKAGASIHCIEPSGWRADHFVGNKVGGLQIPAETDRILLVDTDAIILRDFSEICQQHNCLAAGPDDHPKTSMRQWRHIAQALGEPLTQERGSCMIDQLRLPKTPRAWARYQVPRRELRETVPYFNSGVVLAPRQWDLPSAWNKAYRDIAGAFEHSPDLRRSILHSDQAAFALAADRLRRQGRRIHVLPATLHARWRHLFAGTPKLDSMAILHLTTFLHPIRGRHLSDDALRSAIDDYCLPKMNRRMTRMAVGHALEGRPVLGFRRRRDGLANSRRLRNHIMALCDHWVSPTLRKVRQRQQEAATRTASPIVGRPALVSARTA